MCQYDSRCRVGRHRPGTICPYAGHTPHSGGFGWSANYGSTGQTKSAGSSGTDNIRGAVQASERGPQLWGGGSVVDLLVWIIFLYRWDGVLTAQVIIVGGLLMLLPFFIGLELLSKCHAWINDGTRRCENPRKGFMRRCSHHRSQALTLYDAAGGLSMLIGCLNVLAFLNALGHQS